MILPVTKDAKEPASTNMNGMMINVYHRKVLALANMRNAHTPNIAGLIPRSFLFFLICYLLGDTLQDQRSLTILR